MTQKQRTSTLAEARERLVRATTAMHGIGKDGLARFDEMDDMNLLDLWEAAGKALQLAGRLELACCDR